MASGGLTDLEFVVLMGTLRAADEAYGISIARELEGTGHRSVPLGTIYATLDRLERRGLVRSSVGAPTAERGGRAKKYFRVTPAGLRRAKETQRALVSLWRGIPELGGDSA